MSDIAKLLIASLTAFIAGTRDFIEKHFREFYLAGLFLTGAVLLIRYGQLAWVSDWIQKGVVIGAILLLIQKVNPPPEVKP